MCVKIDENVVILYQSLILGNVDDYELEDIIESLKYQSLILGNVASYCHYCFLGMSKVSISNIR